MPAYIDQLQRVVNINSYPQRIISLVPSQTELLVDLGLGDRIVGLTKFCIHPRGFKNEKQIIGGTKNFHIDKIDALKPDLIIGNKEENYQEGIEMLMEKYPVWMSDIFKLSDACEMIRAIGKITSTSDKAMDIVNSVIGQFDSSLPKLGSAVYLIWNDPIMCAGSNTFIDQMLDFAGFENLVNFERYPVVSLETIQSLNPKFLLLSSEPFPFKEKHIAFFESKLQKTKIILVNGEPFSWYGSRLSKSMTYFKSLHGI
ncbi:helical backbone metal receptor [Belliella kenyensis]|uniref:Helical backbone metal receptor n=1 Tax=Belliella kenyensis TaxID=1472724 RepID=A0ABV8EH47_9BACT|nr:helical backbone metal receptor [Belliella kenyensis]MCH7403064.1 helical backbone metal receptor [Belliella kenyensis]MDN3602233.1 helical backbone metal receptor [Belliella kenyensis]